MKREPSKLNLEEVPRIPATRVTNWEVAAYLEGAVSGETGLRVATELMDNPSLRQAAAYLRQRDSAWEQEDSASSQASAMTPVTPERVRRVTASISQMIETLAAGVGNSAVEAPEPTIQPQMALRGRGFWSLSLASLQEAQQALAAVAQRALALPEAALGWLDLPCLAPATATTPPAPAELLEVRRQTLQTAEGVRLEFHQLPGEATRLRLLVDASAMNLLSGEKSPTISRNAEAATARTGTENRNFGYNVAYLTLEVGEEPDMVRHALVIPLNTQGRGLLDLTLDGTGEKAFPRPHGVCRLVGVQLLLIETVPG